MLATMEWSRPDDDFTRKLAFQGNIKSLRSLYWRIFLGQLPGPMCPTNATTKNLNHLKKASWTLNLERIRLEWDGLKTKFLRAPDGLWLEDSSRHCSDHQLETSNHGNNLFNYHNLNPNPVDHLLSDLGVNNPLSQHEALRKMIEQDVIRTFPELKYFRQARTQVMLTNILHVYCKIHEDVGYRQGMHEVLGVLLETLDLDSLICPMEEKKPGLMYQVLSREFLEHDVFNLFCLLMRPMRNWYDPNLSIPLRDLANRETTPLTSLGFTPRLAIVSPIEYNSFDDGSQLVHPLVEKCASIFHVYLKQLDPELWAHIDKLEIEPQLWGIRWLRLIFTREFTYRESILLWDGIFAHEDSTSLRLVDFISIAMLLRIRENLLESDYSDAVQLILKFPKPADGDSRMNLLLYQAVLLSRFPTHSTVMSIIQQNLDLKLYPSHSSISRSNSWFSIGSKAPIASSTAPITQNPSIRNHQTVPLQASSHPLNLTQAIEHDESQSPLGTSKTPTLAKPRSLLGALADLRKSYSATLRVDNQSLTELTPTSTAQFQSSSGSRNLDSPISIKQDVQGKSHTSPPQLSQQQQRQLQTNYLANQEVGQALRLCVDALEQNMLNKLEAHQEILSHDSSQGLALGVLKHIRDIMLSGFSSNFDSNVMSPLMEYQSATTSTHQSYSDRSLAERHSRSSSSSLNHSDASSPKNDKYSPSQSSVTTRDLPDYTFANQVTDSIQFSNDISSVSLSVDRSKSLEELNINDNSRPRTITRHVSLRLVDERNRDIQKILPLDLRYKFLDPIFLSSPI